MFMPGGWRHDHWNLHAYRHLFHSQVLRQALGSLPDFPMKSTSHLIFLVAWSLVSATTAFAAPRTLQPNQVSQLRTLAWDGTDDRLVLQVDTVIEAPNWTPDGQWLIYNSNGLLYKVPADGSTPPVQIPVGLTNVNNDHVLSPDGSTVYLSANGHLFAAPITGGKPRKISNDHAPERNFRYFLHGVSPDGKLLAYVGAENVGTDIWGRLDLYTIPAAGGRDVQLTNTPAPDDGPEYSPDGKWIYFNSELCAKVAGHAQIFRMRPDGSGTEQLTHDERINWFPHVSPDGQWVVYLSFPPGTVKHPADKEVLLRRIRPDGRDRTELAAFLGGQGTFNVHSWAPDSRRFAYISYPILGPGERKTQ